MQFRACRKAFLWERSVKIRTKTPYMFTPKKSRALATSCRERTGADVGSVQARQVLEGTQRPSNKPLSQLQTHSHPGISKHHPDRPTVKQSRWRMGQKHTSAHITDSNVPACQGLGGQLYQGLILPPSNFTCFLLIMSLLDLGRPQSITIFRDRSFKAVIKVK